MPNCHQCDNNITGASKIAPECSYCFKKNVTLCNNCSWFELGPIPAPAALTTQITAVNNLIQQCPQKKRKKILKKRREKTLKAIGERCNLINEQVKDKGFKNEVLKACEIYDHIYHVENLTGTAKDDEKKKQKMFHTLIIVFLSARKKCSGYRNDGPYSENSYNPPDPPDNSLLIHKHDAPKVAAKHLELCFFNSEFIPVSEQDKAKASLETLVVERLLREKIGISGGHKMLGKLKTGYNLTNDDIKDVIKKNAILYQTCTAIMPVEAKKNFDPRRAHGWLLPEHKEKIFGKNPADPPQYTNWAKTQIGTLIASSGIAGSAPVNRWSDTTVSSLNIQGFNDIQKEYLQSIPKFDNTGTAANRSECENEMRSKVKYQIQKLFRNVTTAVPSMQNIFQNYINVTPKRWDDLLDGIIDDMNSGTYWVESSSTAMLIELFENALSNGNHGTFQLKSETLLRKKTVNWSDVFDKCPKNSSGSANGNFVGIKFHPNDLKDRKDGRDAVKEWYLDWRHDKDEVIYNCFDFSLDELPNFTSLSPWTKAPEPNVTYGAHMIVWDSEILKRAVITLGDWGTPRRSKLMLLRDMLCPIERMDGSEYSFPVKKYQTFERILLHFESNLQNPPSTTVTPKVRLTSQFSSCINSTTKQFTGNKIDMSTSVLENLECHIFGPLIISRDAISLLLCMDREHMNDNDAQPNKYDKLIADIRAGKTKQGLQFDVEEYNYENNGRNKLMRLDLYNELEYGNIMKVIGTNPP